MLVLCCVLFYFYLWIGIIFVLLDPAEPRTAWRRWGRRLVMWLFWAILWPVESFADWLAARFPKPAGGEADSVLPNPMVRESPSITPPMIPEPALDNADMEKVDAAMGKLLREMEDEAQRRAAG